MTRFLVGLLMVATTCFGVRAGNPTPSSPEQQLKALEGKWQVTWSVGGGASGSSEGQTNPSLMQALTKEKTFVTITGNKLAVGDGGVSATLANDLDLPSTLRGLKEEVEKSTRGDQLLMLSLPNGRGMLASSFLEGDLLTLRYPAGCCSRSGTVIQLTRVK